MENNNDIQLIKIEAVVREEMFVDVKKALTDIGVNGITAYQVVCAAEFSGGYVGVCTGRDLICKEDGIICGVRVFERSLHFSMKRQPLNF